MPEQPKKEKLTPINQGLILAALPVMGFWIAYLFEYGYSQYFGIPASLIVINATTIASVSLSLLTGILAYIFIFDGLFSRSWRKVDAVMRWSIYRLLATTFSVLCAGLLLNYGFPLIILVTALAASIVGFLIFIQPLIAKRDISGYLNKLRAYRGEELADDTYADSVAKNTSPVLVLLVFGLLLLSFMSAAFGTFKARTQTDFFMLTHPEDLVVLRHYGGTLVTAKYSSSKTILNQRILVNLADTERITLMSSPVGPLAIQTPDRPEEVIDLQSEKDEATGNN